MSSEIEAVRVLLVDDEVDFVEPLGKRLRFRGFGVTTAANGDEALDKLRDADFDVVLLDLVMPGRDGLQTLRDIKSHRPLTEVIILSGKGTEEAAIEGMQCGAFDFLAKPPEIVDLVEKIHDAHARKAEHYARIERALQSGREGREVMVEEVASEETTAVERLNGRTVSCHGRLVVLGRKSEFSEALIAYAVEMAERLSYEIIALNAAGFSQDAFLSFPSARERVCRDFRLACEQNVMAFRQAAFEKRIRFSHRVRYSGQNEAAREIQQEVGEVDFVVFEPTDGSIEPTAGANILVYSPT